VKSICESTRPAWTTNNPGAFIFWMLTGVDELPATWVDQDQDTLMQGRNAIDRDMPWPDINPQARRSESEINRLMSVLDQLEAEEAE
jgi:hypothetical protein